MESSNDYTMSVIKRPTLMHSNFRMKFMKMSHDTRITNRRTDAESGERFYELTGDLYSLAFFAFYIDEEEREENFILDHILE